MDAKLKEGCWNCKFWNCSDSERLGPTYSQCECRNKSPTFLGKISTEYNCESTGWPKTYGNDWCGDWKRSGFISGYYTEQTNPKE